LAINRGLKEQGVSKLMISSSISYVEDGR